LEAIPERLVIIMQLTEKYRPRTWPEVKGQDKAVKVLSKLEKAGNLSGQAYFITGKTGVGKTTLARIIAGKVSDNLHTMEFNASRITVNNVREWAENAMYGTLTGAGRVYILNEAHGLRRDVVRELLVFLEDLKHDTTVIFTTTLEGQLHFEDSQIDATPLQTRCIQIRLTNQGLLKPFTALCLDIASREGLEVKPAAIERIIKESGNSCRAGINALIG